MNQKVVVIGSNAFSAAHYVDFLLKKGCDVIGMSRSDAPHGVFLPHTWSPNKGKYQFHAYDLNNHLNEIMDCIHTEQPDYVVNYAAQSMVAQSWQHPEHWFQTNVVSTIKFHDKLRHAKFIKKYVHVTTPEVYGSTQGFIKEGTPFHPSTPYAVSRAAADMSLRTFFEAYDFPVVFTRAANVYGPGQQLYRIIPRAMLYFMLGKPLELHGGGTSQRSFIHINDVSQATWSVMLDGVPGQTYHISTNEIVTVRGLIEKICELMKIDFSQSVKIVGERLGKDAAYLLDSEKIRKELNWVDGISLSEGLTDCLNWVTQNLEILQNQPYDYMHKA